MEAGERFLLCGGARELVHRPRLALARAEQDQQCPCNGREGSAAHRALPGGTRGTWYSSSTRSISCCRRRRKSLRCASRAASCRRTAIEMAYDNGRPPSLGDGTNRVSSGSGERAAKNPARGPHTTATSTSPLAIAVTICDGGLF